MTFKPSKFDHDYSMAILSGLTEVERREADAHVVRLNEVCIAHTSNEAAPGSRKSFEKAYYSLGKTLRKRGESYPAL